MTNGKDESCQVKIIQVLCFKGTSTHFRLLPGWWYIYIYICHCLWLKNPPDFVVNDGWVELKDEWYSLLACYPRTGRTHQIRAHLQFKGLPRKDAKMIWKGVWSGNVSQSCDDLSIKHVNLFILTSHISLLQCLSFVFCIPCFIIFLIWRISLRCKGESSWTSPVKHLTTGHLPFVAVRPPLGKWCQLQSSWTSQTSLCYLGWQFILEPREGWWFDGCAWKSWTFSIEVCLTVGSSSEPSCFFLKDRPFNCSWPASTHLDFEIPFLL